MNVVLAFHSVDRVQAIRWLKWVAELGKVKTPHKLWLLSAASVDPTETNELAPLAFEEVGHIQDADAVISDWTGPLHTRDASGPNSAFRQAAWHFMLGHLGPWFFCEPDALPTRPDWLDVLEVEYLASGKPFMGNYVRVPNVLDHLTGVSVYPQNTPALAPNIVSRRHAVIENRTVEIAFDVAGATEVLPQAHITKLIQHCPRHPGFGSMEEVDALVDPNAVIFHMSKEGSLIPFLREKISGVRAVTPEMEKAVVDLMEAMRRINGIPEPGAECVEKTLSFAERIRHHCGQLQDITAGMLGREKVMLDELRKLRLIPQARKRR